MGDSSGNTYWRLASVGAAIALAIAVWQGLGAPTYSFSSNKIAARVNGIEITTLDFELAQEAVRQDKRGALSKSDEQRILKTLIKEELLVQRAVELGLFETDRGVRKAAVDAMLQFAISRSPALPTGDDLKIWFKENQGQFSKAGRLKAAVAVLPSEPLAKSFSQAVAASDFEAAVENVPSAQLMPIPDILLQPTKMMDYTGPELVQQMSKLSVGDIAGPFVNGADRYMFVWLKDKTEPQIPSFEQARETVEAMWSRTVQERAVVEYMDDLWRDAEIETSVDLAAH